MRTKLFGTILASTGAIVAVTAVSYSIYLNPPSTAKAHALDQQRLQGLQQIDNAVKAYYRANHALPDRLDAIRNYDGLNAHSGWQDPITHQPYEYGAVSKTSFRLCADFSADTDADENPYYGEFRKHHKGHDCFVEDVNGQ